VLVALLSLGTYAIVLYVYTVARVGYAGSIREVSIVFAAVAGWRFLGERFGAVRTVGAVLIFCGILSIAILG
jgi:drug/metabolite transporter (DMT)-like permease